MTSQVVHETWINAGDEIVLIDIYLSQAFVQVRIVFQKTGIAGVWHR